MVTIDRTDTDGYSIEVLHSGVILEAVKGTSATLTTEEAEAVLEVNDHDTIGDVFVVAREAPSKEGDLMFYKDESEDQHIVNIHADALREALDAAA